MTTDEEELARQIWELMKDPPTQKQGGYQCLSVYKGLRCARQHGHSGQHAWRHDQWTDADISPVPMLGPLRPALPPPPDLQHDLRALSVVVTDIRALLTDIRDGLSRGRS